MDLAAITSFISTVGFPIFIAVFFLLRLKKQDDRHAEQFDQLTVAINNNTKVIQELSYKLEEGGKVINESNPN